MTKNYWKVVNYASNYWKNYITNYFMNDVKTGRESTQRLCTCCNSMLQQRAPNCALQGLVVLSMLHLRLGDTKTGFLPLFLCADSMRAEPKPKLEFFSSVYLSIFSAFHSLVSQYLCVSVHLVVCPTLLRL